MPLPPDLSKPIFAFAPHFADRVIKGECVCCQSPRIRDCDFKDTISKKEYSISGLCQQCQNQVFDVPDERREQGAE